MDEQERPTNELVREALSKVYEGMELYANDRRQDGKATQVRAAELLTAAIAGDTADD